MMEGACKYLGLRTSDAGKLMGLAGHGKWRDRYFDNVILNETGYSIANFPEDSVLISNSLDEQEKVIQLWRKYFLSRYPLDVKRLNIFDLLKGGIVNKLDFNQTHKDFSFFRPKHT